MPRAVEDVQAAAVTKRLAGLAERKPELAEMVAFYQALLPVLGEARADVEPLNLDAETARYKLAAGLPLLPGEDLPLDLAATRALFIRLCRIVEDSGPSRSRWSLFGRGRLTPNRLLEQAGNGDGAALRAAAAGQIRQAVEQDQLDLPAVWSSLAAGNRLPVERLAHSLKLDADLLRTLAQNSLKPALRAWAQMLRDRVDLEQWQRGQCPICGSPPVLAEIQGKEGGRRLRCGLCGAGWAYPRLKCAFCGNDDHKLLGYISVEGEAEKYRLQTCEACGDYIKVVVTFDPTPVDLLPVEDLATLHLDLIAAERNYAHTL